MTVLLDRKIVVGVGGGIAAFKSVVLVRELSRRGAKVKVAMTPASQKFIGSATFAGLTGEHPVCSLWEHAGEIHVELGQWADAMVVAPATMNLLARLAAGAANDPVLATLACTNAPRLLAPAMHTNMWRQPSTQRNVAQLRADGFSVVGPVQGALASGQSGDGRMAEPEQITDALAGLLRPRDLHGHRIVVTAGPTYEDVDPVRFLGNRSTGKMGFAIATALAQRGAQLTLISGPTTLRTPVNVERIDVRSAVQMHDAIGQHTSQAAAVVMAAAVADYRPAQLESEKVKKTAGPWQLELTRNPDILAELGCRTPRPVLVGFALETDDLETRAKAKLASKNADLIVANLAADGFAGDDTAALLVSADGTENLGQLSKSALAHRIGDWLRSRLAEHSAPTM